MTNTTNIEAEKGFLGALITSPNLVDEYQGKITQDYFSEPLHKDILNALYFLSAKGTPIGEAPVIIEVAGKLGGPKTVAINNIVSTYFYMGNDRYYYDKIKECYLKRRLIAMSKTINDLSDKDNINESIAETERLIYALSDESTQNTTVSSINDVLSKAKEKFKERQSMSGDIIGVPSGFFRLDSMTLGFQPEDLVIIGARPSIGKTALALSMMANIAQNNISCGFFSAEMSSQSVADRLIAITARIPLMSVRKAHMTAVQENLAFDNSVLRDKKLYICDEPNIKLSVLIAKARKMARENGIKILFIDYIGLIDAEIKATETWQQVTYISKSLKALARDLKIPIVALSQLNRDAEGAKPSLANVRGSGAIEQDADVVMFLHRDRDSNDELIPTKLMIVKQRNGETGDVDLVFNKKLALYEQGVKANETR